MNDFRFGNPALAAFIADMYEPMRKPMRTPDRVRLTDLQIVKNRREDVAATAALKAPAAPVKTYACETCEDTGEAMQMVCYGGPPVERMGECPDCKPKVKGKTKPLEAEVEKHIKESGWITWYGAAMPPMLPKDFEFRLKLRNGMEHDWMEVSEARLQRRRWSNDGLSTDIVAYQLRSTEAKTPKLINGAVYAIEFTGAATGTLVTRYARWVNEGWCGGFETAEVARVSSLTPAPYLNGTRSTLKGRMANVKVLRHIPEEK